MSVILLFRASRLKLTVLTFVLMSWGFFFFDKVCFVSLSLFFVRFFFFRFDQWQNQSDACDVSLNSVHKYRSNYREKGKRSRWERDMWEDGESNQRDRGEGKKIDSRWWGESFSAAAQRTTTFLCSCFVLAWSLSHAWFTTTCNVQV